MFVDWIQRLINGWHFVYPVLCHTVPFELIRLPDLPREHMVRSTLPFDLVDSRYRRHSNGSASLLASSQISWFGGILISVFMVPTVYLSFCLAWVSLFKRYNLHLKCHKHRHHPFVSLCSDPKVSSLIQVNFLSFQHFLPHLTYSPWHSLLGDRNQS